MTHPRSGGNKISDQLTKIKLLYQLNLLEIVSGNTDTAACEILL